jgi:putative mycofactocin binding protein MftB
MACAASTEPPAQTIGLDPSRPYRLHPQVALRPEPFGALAYHYGNRRLSFVRSAEVVDLLESLDQFDSLDGALAASPIDPARYPAVLRALGQLHASEMLCAR